MSYSRKNRLISNCEMCDREKDLTFHHLIPRTLHKNKWFEKNFEKKDMQTRHLMLCKDCHSTIHRLIEEKELGKNYNTLELLLKHESIAKFVKFIKKQN